mgnify:CR=1 FL=1|tara:strand:- start:479 stop:649 length:171 start_codon:yes stop_codon:yes gene_type:complete
MINSKIHKVKIIFIDARPLIIQNARSGKILKRLTAMDIATLKINIGFTRVKRVDVG